MIVIPCCVACAVLAAIVWGLGAFFAKAAGTELALLGASLRTAMEERHSPTGAAGPEAPCDFRSKWDLAQTFKGHVARWVWLAIAGRRFEATG
jgi:hypothetical protein